MFLLLSQHTANIFVQGVSTVKSELLEDIITESQPYKSPEVLLKRSDPARSSKNAAHIIEPNEYVLNYCVIKFFTGK